MKNIFLKIFVLCFFIFVLENSTKAQHDAHRGAVREIVRGEYDTAEERIEKVMQDPSAIWRSLTNAYERAGREVESEGEEYKRFVIPENYFVMSMLASMKGDTDMALAYAQNAVKEGLPFERILAGPRDAFAALHKTQAFQEWAEKESKLLIHGPKMGNVTSDEASFWVRTAEEAEVKVLVRPEGYSSQKDNKSAASRTFAGSDYTTVVRIEDLRPNTAYNYSLEVDGKNIPVQDATFKTYPVQGTFKIIASSVPMSPGTKGEGKGSLDTWDRYSDERNHIHNFLYENNISGLQFYRPTGIVPMCAGSHVKTDMTFMNS